MKRILFFLLAFCFAISCEKEDNDSLIEPENDQEVIIDRVDHITYTINSSIKEHQYGYISSSRFAINLNPRMDSVNCKMELRLNMRSNHNWNLYVNDIDSKTANSWVGTGLVTIKSRRQDNKLFDVVGYKNVFVSVATFDLPFVYTGGNIISSDAIMREGEKYKTYKMLHLYCIIETFRKSGVPFTFKRINTNDNTVIDLTNAYIHHDFANPDGIENPDSLDMAVDMWNQFCNTVSNIELELEVLEIPVQLTEISATVHVSELESAGIKTNDVDLYIPLSIHK